VRILVAGGAGYVGSVLVPILDEHGYEVTVADALWFGNHLPKNISVLHTDLFKLKQDDLAGYDQIIFLAGVSNDPMAEFDPAMNFIHNAALPSYLAFTAKQAGVKRFIYASSCSIYGYTLDRLYDEEGPITCGYPYGISKFEGEQGAMLLQDDNFSVIALRQGTVNGYSPRMRFDLIINTMFKSALTEGIITVNNPSIWRPLIDVRDTSYAFLRAVQAAPHISGAFNVAYDNFTVGQVADLVRDAVEGLTGKRIRIAINDKQDFRNYKVSRERAQTILGFSPKYDVADMVQSLHDHIDEYDDYSEDSFYNIEIFTKMADVPA
jgi:nucleoside-diphosphate-sugar epimerase